MISGGKDVRAEIEEVFGYGWRYPEAARCVFCIDDEQVDSPLRYHVSQMLAHNAPARASEDIPHKQNPQTLSPAIRSTSNLYLSARD
jgi:hypothetical protein